MDCLKSFALRIGTGFFALALWEGTSGLIAWPVKASLRALAGGTAGFALVFGFCIVSLFIAFLASWLVCSHRYSKGGGVACAIALVWPVINVFILHDSYTSLPKGYLIVLQCLYFSHVLFGFYGGDLGRRAREKHEKAQMQEVAEASAESSPQDNS